MATLFTRIIEGEIPSYRVAEDAEFYAFLDINPVQPGHTLVCLARRSTTSSISRMTCSGA